MKGEKQRVFYIKKIDERRVIEGGARLGIMTQPAVIRTNIGCVRCRERTEAKTGEPRKFASSRQTW